MLRSMSPLHDRAQITDNVALQYGFTLEFRLVLDRLNISARTRD